MPIVKKTLDNPHGLSIKQRLVIEDMAEDIKNGNGLNQRKSHGKIYNTSTPQSTSVTAHQNMSKTNFREALIEALEKRKVIGVNGKVSQRLVQGLDAKQEGKPMYKVRLSYIQEINKVTGVYAPTTINQKTLRLSATLSPQQVEDRIKSIKEELEE